MAVYFASPSGVTGPSWSRSRPQKMPGSAKSGQSDRPSIFSPARARAAAAMVGATSMCATGWRRRRPGVQPGPGLPGGRAIGVAGGWAKFGVSEVGWSRYPMGGSAVRIPRQIPYTIACELLLTGEHISARRALELGLVGHVVPDGQALAKAVEIGHAICENGPLAVQALPKTLRDEMHLKFDGVAMAYRRAMREQGLA